MKFIFPQNYNFENKFLGVIDYLTIFVNVIWYIFVFLILSIIPISFQIKIFIFILCCFPLFLISITGFNGENVVYVFRYIFLFLVKTKLYLYFK